MCYYIPKESIFIERDIIMKVKKVDIFESILIAILVYINIRSAFTNLHFVLCLVFAIGVATVFLLLYHERYIGVILHIGVCILWTTLITMFLSMFSIFYNNMWLLIIIGLALLFFLLHIHGLRIYDFIRNIKNIEVRTIKSSSNSIIQDMIKDYKAEYDQYLFCKEKLYPVFSQILSDPDAPDHIKATTSDYIMQMNTVEKENKSLIKISKRKIFFGHTQKYMLNCTKKLRLLNIEFEGHIKTINEREYREQEERYRQSQQYRNNQQTASEKEPVTSYFNGCDSLSSLKERYRDLCKVYHPDSGNGSQQEFVKIQEEFETLKKKYS